MIDRDEDGRPTEAFYAEAEPCESCGEPTFRGRVWNAEYQLWVAVDCDALEAYLKLPADPTEMQQAEADQQAEAALLKANPARGAQTDGK
jgi:hypothetical protein